MLKILRQLRGDSADVARLRAETYDEIRDAAEGDGNGNAKNALSLGGTASGFFAKLSDLATYATAAAMTALDVRVTTIEGYFTGSAAKLAASIKGYLGGHTISFDWNGTSIDAKVDAVEHVAVSEAVHAGNSDKLGTYAADKYARPEAGITIPAGQTFLGMQSDSAKISMDGSIAPLEVRSAGGNGDAMVAFHLPGDTAWFLGLDRTTKDLCIGGWSKGANKYRVIHEGNMGNYGWILKSQAPWIGQDVTVVKGAQILSGVDLHTIVAQGEYVGENCVNRPEGWSWARYKVEVLDAGWIKITAEPLWTSNKTIMVKWKEGGTWTGWDYLRDVNGKWLNGCNNADTVGGKPLPSKEYGANDFEVAKLLRWKNYGDNHVIFDASNSTTPSGTACNNTTPDVGWTATHPTLMGWNGANTFGVRVDTARRADTAMAALPWHYEASNTTYGSIYTALIARLTKQGEKCGCACAVRIGTINYIFTKVARDVGPPYVIFFGLNLTTGILASVTMALGDTTAVISFNISI